MLDLRAISQSPKRGDRQDRRDRERVFDEPRLPLRCAMTRRRAPQRVGDEATLLAPFVLSSHAIKWPWLRLSAGSDPREARTARAPRPLGSARLANREGPPRRFRGP